MSGLLLLIVGNGFFKPNISTQVGNLYKPGDSRIDRAYSIFYVGINVGAFFSPLICGTLGESIRLSVGLLCRRRRHGRRPDHLYLRAAHTAARSHRAASAPPPKTKKPLTSQDWKAVIALILLCIPTTFFWATYEQQGNTINLWAQRFHRPAAHPRPDRLADSGHVVPVIQSIHDFGLHTAGRGGCGRWQAETAREPSTVTKMALGDFLLAVSYVIMAVAAHITGPHGHASWLWLLVFFAVITLGELYLSPIGLALVARVAPPQILSAMMGLWFITSFTGNLLQGYIGSFFSQMDKVTLLPELCAVIAAAAGVVTWVFNLPAASPFSRSKGPLHQPIAPSRRPILTWNRDRRSDRRIIVADEDDLKKETRAAHAGRMSAEHFGAVNTPVYRASTILYRDLATLESGKVPYIYGRRGTPLIAQP